MKCILKNYGINMDSQQRQVAKSQASDMVIARGTSQKPQPPRDLFVQSGPRGILINWRPNSGLTTDIAGWRVYKDDENKLFTNLQDPSTTQAFIEATSGTTPPVTNLFVSSVNKLGIESAKVQIQASPIAETGAPAMPVTPPSFQVPFKPNPRGPFLPNEN